MDLGVNDNIDFLYATNPRKFSTLKNFHYRENLLYVWFLAHLYISGHCGVLSDESDLPDHLQWVEDVDSTIGYASTG